MHNKRKLLKWRREALAFNDYSKDLKAIVQVNRLLELTQALIDQYLLIEQYTLDENKKEN